MELRDFFDDESRYRSFFTISTLSRSDELLLKFDKDR